MGHGSPQNHLRDEEKVMTQEIERPLLASVAGPLVGVTARSQC
jgi:hypothetical protein